MALRGAGRVGAVPGTIDVDVRSLRPQETERAIGVLARGMCDNPLHVAAYGPDRQRRMQVHGQLMRRFFQLSPKLETLCAVRDGEIVGVGAAAASGTCRPVLPPPRALLSDLRLMGPRTAIAVARWLAAWQRRDPAEPHIHFGPFAVLPELQGKGVGSALLREHCRRFDAAGANAYLETDRERNVRLYRRFGFETIAEARVLGVPNWFMLRPPERTVRS